jgi:glutaredoxin 2
VPLGLAKYIKKKKKESVKNNHKKLTNKQKKLQNKVSKLNLPKLKTSACQKILLKKKGNQWEKYLQTSDKDPLSVIYK